MDDNSSYIYRRQAVAMYTDGRHVLDDDSSYVYRWEVYIGILGVMMVPM